MAGSGVPVEARTGERVPVAPTLTACNLYAISMQSIPRAVES